MRGYAGSDSIFNSIVKRGRLTCVSLFEMSEQKLFANDGFGWYCVTCAESSKNTSQEARLLKEGESESKDPAMSESARAKWSDGSRSVLVCELCGVSEPIAG